MYLTVKLLCYGKQVYTQAYTCMYLLKKSFNSSKPCLDIKIPFSGFLVKTSEH